MKALKYILPFTLFWATTVSAQLNPMASLYFQNPYLGNPALAGTYEGWEINAASKVQWTSIEGSPVMQTATATLGNPGKKIGMGINLYNENAGAFLRTSLKATYAYHISINNDQSYLDFGLSMGIASEYLDHSKVLGEPDDPAVIRFSGRKSYIDGDFGIVYRGKNIYMELAVPNVKQFLNKDLKNNNIDRSRYMAALGYRFSGPVFTLDMKAMKRGVENYIDLYDLAAQFTCFDDKLISSAIYHSTGSLTLGIGTLYQNQLRILCTYSSGTADLRSHSNGEFEIALQYSLK